MIKQMSLAALIVLCMTATVTAQKKFDELTYPKLDTFHEPDISTFKLDNGITFFLLEDHELPVIDANVVVRTGGVLVPAEKEGLASITGTVIRSGGTESYPADSLNKLLEDKAASMETGISFSSGSAGMNVLKEDFDDLLPVFVDLLTHPAFPEDKIKLAKTQEKSSISRRNDNNQQIGYREFDRLIYGPNSAYGRNTEYKTINNITRQDIVNFHKKYFVGKNMMIGLVGDFKTKDMKKKLSKAFGSIPAGTPAQLDFPKVDYSYHRTINFVNKPDVNQSFVLLGHIGGLRSNPDYPKVQVMNYVLSGGFSGRLFQVVRTEKGLAYSVFGQYGMNTFYKGEFYAGVMTKSATTAEAIDAVIEQVKRLQNKPVTQDELADTKDQMLNSLVFRNDSYEKILGRRLDNEYRGLPKDAFDKYVEGIKSTTVQDVQEMAQKYLHPEQVQILVVGNKNEIGDQLQKYGDVNTIDISIPQPGGENKKVSGDAAKGEQLLGKMSETLIAPDTDLQSLSLKGQVTQYSSQLPDGKMTMKMSATIDYPDAVEQTIQTPNGTMILSLKNGKGTLKMMGQERPMPPQMTKGLKETLNRSYLAIAMKADELHPQYVGNEDFQDTTYAKVNVEVDGKNVVFLINSETGYPRLMRYQQFNPRQGSQVKVEERYSDWHTTGGVAYAYDEVSLSDGKKSSESTLTSHTINQ